MKTTPGMIGAIMTFGLAVFLAAPAESLENGAPCTLNDSSDLADRTPAVRGGRLRQSDSAAPRVSGEAPTRRFEAGGSIVWPGWYAGPPDGAGGWFTVGAGRWRLQIDYLHRGQRKEISRFLHYGGRSEEYTYVDGWTSDSLFLFAARHFRADRRIKTHLLFGAGYYGFRGYSCEAPLRRPGETPVSYEHPDTCGRNQGDSGEGRVMGALGAGIETAYGSRFFLRVQTRGIVVTERHSEGSAWLSVLARSWQAIAREMVVGVGVRF